MCLSLIWMTHCKNVGHVVELLMQVHLNIAIFILIVCKMNDL